MSCLIDTKTPGGEVNCMTARPYPGLELPKFRELTAKKWGKNGPWNCRLTLPKSTKMMVVRPLMTNLKMTVRDDCTVSACSPPPPTHSVCKSSHPLFVRGGEVCLCTDVFNPSLQLLASEIKQTSLSNNLACLLAFE